MKTVCSIFATSFTLALALLVIPAKAQYQGPESVEYDPVGDRYFVSTTTGASIKVRDQAGVVSNFVNVSPAPYGLEIMGDTLFACSGGSVKGYSLTNASLVFNLNLGASFLNGLTTDGTHLYATDFSGTRIHKVDVANNSQTILVANTAGTPNGIVWDPTEERLVVVFWGSNASIKAFDRNTGAASTLVANTGLANIDGITIDCLGNFLVASWSPDRITRYDPSFSMPGVDLGIPGLQNPADIDFDLVNGRVCVPNSGNNTVTLFDIDCSTGMIDRPGVSAQLVPNPTAGHVYFDPPMVSAEPYMVIDTRGLLVAGGTLPAGGSLDLGGLRDGIYLIRFNRIPHQVRVVKQ